MMALPSAGHLHSFARDDEEEEMAVALALSASLAESSLPAGAQLRPQSGGGGGYQQPRQPSPAQPAPQLQYQQQAPQPRRPQPTPSSYPLVGNANNCAGCNKPCWFGHINALGRRWHSDCFLCAHCMQPLTGGLSGAVQFSVGSADGRPYHQACYRAKFHPRCVVCHELVPEQAGGRLEWKENTFWKDKYCPRHSNEEIPPCCCCTRLRPNGVEWVELRDGRQLCLDCLGSVVLDTAEAQPLYASILEFFRRQGLAHEYRAPLYLVDAAALNDYAGREGRRADGGPVFHVRGLCMAEVWKSIPSIVRQAGMSVGVSQVALQRTRCHVSAILCCYGLPRLLTGCILAHELMHAYLRMRGVSGIDLPTEEGLCQLMALLWLDAQDVSSTSSTSSGPEPAAAFLTRLASFLAYQIRSDTSHVYGDGFRAAFEAFQVHGLHKVVESVVAHGWLPRS